MGHRANARQTPAPASQDRARIVFDCRMANGRGMMRSPADIMDPLQEQHERWVGDQVIERYNTDYCASFQFYRRPGEAPDLEYRDGSRLLGVEVATAYYDIEDAKFKWLEARKRPDAPRKWYGKNFDESLVENINSELVDKCAKSYGPNCVLAVCVYPSLTRAWEMESRLKDVRVPATNPFDAIYLYGEFPAPIPNPAERRVWKLA
jgi:hypothetical protein